jgi:hypothetical protein
MKNQLNTLLGHIVILGVALAPAGTAIAAAPDGSMLAQRVEQVLTGAQLRNADVKVVVTDGRVDLQGWVDAPNDVLQAMKLTAAVPGVETVVSSLRTWRSTERYY